MAEREIELTLNDKGEAEDSFKISGILKVIKIIPQSDGKFQVEVNIDTIPIFKKLISKPELFYLVIQPVMYDERNNMSDYSSFGSGNYLLNDILNLKVNGPANQKIILTFRWSSD